MVRSPAWSGPEAAIALSLELARLSRQGCLLGAARDVFDYWYRQALLRKVSPDQARALPAQVFEARDRLLAHMRQAARDDRIDERAVYEAQAAVFRAPDIPGAVEVVMAAGRCGLRLETRYLEPFLMNLPTVETLRRFEKMAPWLARVNAFNPGMALTPNLVSYLAQPEDFDSRLEELDRLREATLGGRFSMDSVVQKDMEFSRFKHEYAKLNPTIRKLGYIDKPFEELYAMFSELRELPPPQEPDELRLEGEHLLQVRRTAYEAAGLLRFLRELRTQSGRPMVVVGNDRYGRQWVVEPLEGFLKAGDGFGVRYDRVPSHMSTRLTVPSARLGESALDAVGPWSSSAFPREFVRDLAERMPHVVIVDGMNAGTKHSTMKLSRGLQGYANWFAAFNDVRAEGDDSRYEHESCLPPGHLRELRKWYEFVTLRRQLQGWMGPGPTYKVTLWAPEPTEMALLGNFVVPCQLPDVRSERPLVVLANPIIYRTEGDDLPEILRGTRPYYFDGPERHVREEILFGFGPHGLETRVLGHTTATFVDAVQRAIAVEVGRMLEDAAWQAP